MSEPIETTDAELLGGFEVDAGSNGTARSCSLRSRFGHLFKPALLLGAGVLIGLSIHNVTQVRHLLSTTLAKEDVVSLADIPPGTVPYGGGFITKSDNSCYAASCSRGSTCCRNNDQHGYCCAAGNFCFEGGCRVPGTSYCFAGSANVNVSGKGTISMQDLRVGDQVLAQQADAKFTYESVLGFLHATSDDEASNHLIVSHPAGKLRVSPNHIVFLADGSDKLAANLLVGDELLVAHGSGRVASIKSATGNEGMYAPLTASGTIIVDGAVASNYATHSSLTWIPHNVIHAAFFPLRMYHALGFASMFGGNQPATQNIIEGKHPFVTFLEDRVKVPALMLLNLK